ncbi:MAG: hypothetical protein PHO75_02300 [Candidatus Shapirobacteria bacterium]|nr:hypothetical protein [Candidatus Shapirobacteria bacterium]
MQNKTDELGVIIYNKGLCYCSVCVPKAMKSKDIEKITNIMNPTGITSQWKIDKENFKGGEKNPCECDTDPNRKHYLLKC